MTLRLWCFWRCWSREGNMVRQQFQPVAASFWWSNHRIRLPYWLLSPLDLHTHTSLLWISLRSAWRAQSTHDNLPWSPSKLIILISISDLNLHFLLAHCPPWWLMEKPTKIGSDFARTGNCKMPPPGIVLAEILVGSAEKYWSGKRSETYCFWKVRSILGGQNLYEMFAA